MKGLMGLLQEEKDMQLKGGLYHKTQVIAAYNSNGIEGSKLTEEQTRYIYETNTIMNDGEEPLLVDDIIETVNHFRCFDYMLEQGNKELSEEMIKKFHWFIKTGTTDEKRPWFRVGDYKLRPNEVGDRQTTTPDRVEKEMKKLLQTYHSIQKVIFEDIIDFHYRFEYIHPFQDYHVIIRTS